MLVTVKLEGYSDLKRCKVSMIADAHPAMEAANRLLKESIGIE